MIQPETFQAYVDWYVVLLKSGNNLTQLQRDIIAKLMENLYYQQRT